MYIISKDGTERFVDDALYAQAKQGRVYLTETLGKEQADAIFDALGVESEADLTESGQKEIKKEAAQASEPVLDMDEAMYETGTSGLNPDPAAEAIDELLEGDQDEDPDDENESIFAQYEIGAGGKVMTHEEARAAERAQAMNIKMPSRSQRAFRAGVMGYAVYRTSKWSPVNGMMLDDRGELVSEAPLEDGPNTKYRMADPGNPDEADYVRVTEDGKVLCRVQALRDITLADGTVAKAGEWGGWIESESNLSFSDDSWIKDEAVACEASRVSGDALLKDEAVAAGWSRVTDGAVVEDSAAVDDRAVVASSTVSDETAVTGFGKVVDSEIDGESEITGVAEIVSDTGTDVQAGDPADAEARLEQEAAMAEQMDLYGSVDDLDMNAYDHGEPETQPENMAENQVDESAQAKPEADASAVENPEAQAENQETVPGSNPETQSARRLPSGYEDAVQENQEPEVQQADPEPFVG